MKELRVISSDFSLNTFVELGEKSFVPGSGTTIALRIYHTEKNLRYTPPSTAVITLKMVKTDGTYFEKTATMNSDDRSLIFITLTGAQTQDLIGGNIVGIIDLLGDGSSLETAFGYSALRKVITV